MSGAAFIALALYLLGAVLAYSYVIETKAPGPCRWKLAVAWPLVVVAIGGMTAIEIARGRKP